MSGGGDIGVGGGGETGLGVDCDTGVVVVVTQLSLLLGKPSWWGRSLSSGEFRAILIPRRVVSGSKDLGLILQDR